MIKDIFKLIGLTVLISIPLVLVISAFVLLLWNAVIPDIFNLNTITYKQALFLTLLIKLLIQDTSLKVNKE
jgi:hypothetical protein